MMKGYFTLITMMYVFLADRPDIARRKIVWDWLVTQTPWYFWLLLWPVVGTLVAPLIGKFLKRRREQMERRWRENQDEGRRWKRPGDEQWRDRYH